VQRRFLLWLLLWMLGLYALLFHPYPERSWPGNALASYLELVANSSATLLRWCGEQVSVDGSTVLGRFPYVVVLDCAALDAQALFAAAVLAFPAAWRHKAIGLAAGLAAIFGLNVARLALLYFAGAHSLRLFQVLHEEVLVVFVILLVCGWFALWASWALGRLEPSSNCGSASV
jgi:exosortase/archaeosortase family protein